MGFYCLCYSPVAALKDPEVPPVLVVRHMETAFFVHLVVTAANCFNVYIVYRHNRLQCI